MRTVIPFFIGLIILFTTSCTTTEEVIIDNEDPKLDIPFDPSAENDLPSDTGGFSGFVGEGFNINLDSMVNDLPQDVDGFNPVSISDFETEQINSVLRVSFNAEDNITDTYTFIVYSLERFQGIGGFKLRGGADFYSYNLNGLPGEELCILYGFKNNTYLGGVYVWINENN